MIRFVAIGVALLTLSTCTQELPAPAPPRPDDPRVTVAASVAFTEGPTVYRDGSVFLTEMRSERILRFYPDDGRVETFRQPSNLANGLVFDSDWRLVACEGEPARLTRTDIETGEVEVLADEFEGKKFNRLNDVTYDTQGRLYFTDRPEPEDGPESTQVNGVYRLDPDGTLVRLLTDPDIDRPNGIAIAPDDATLYLIEAHPDANRARMIRAYDLAADGSISNTRVFHDFYPGRSGDGMTIDSEGNLYVAAGLHRTRGTSETLDTKPGIHVISPTGEFLDYLRTPEDTITNAAFGGDDMRTLYVTAGKQLLQMRVDVPGTRR